MSKISELRQKQLYHLIFKQGSMKVNDLARLLDVSSETIRKDLKVLEKTGSVIRKHGFVELSNGDYMLPMYVKMQNHVGAKCQIAKKALSYIKEGDTIYVDTGSTGAQIALLLKSFKQLTVVTNSLYVANIVCDYGLTLILAGGQVENKERACYGYYTNAILDSITYDVAFFGCDGLANTNGPTVFSFEQGEIRNHLLRRAKKKILVSDRSKLVKHGVYQYGNFSDFDCVITDAKDDEVSLFKGIKEIVLVQEKEIE